MGAVAVVSEVSEVADRPAAIQIPSLHTAFFCDPPYLLSKPPHGMSLLTLSCYLVGSSACGFFLELIGPLWLCRGWLQQPGWTGPPSSSVSLGKLLSFLDPSLLNDKIRI